MVAAIDPPASPLTERLFPDAEDLETRLELARRHPTDEVAGVARLERCAAWPAVREVIERALRTQAPTLVYGDYDVDGVVATFLLFRYLRSHDVPGNCFLPSRFQHGYGLSADVVEQAAAQAYQALLVLDCGTADAEAVTRARERGLDVAIIDHHEPPAALPAAPLLNPHLEEALPPFCTAGLVYEVLQALRAENAERPVGDELELAGLATLADVVPLVPANWALAHHGLRVLPETANVGLAELIKVSGLHGLTRLTGRQVLFSMVPRLNAAGRMRNAADALSLLQAADKAGAREAALLLDGLNQQRKRAADQVTREALLQATELQASGAAVVYRPRWHVGVLGIVAARLVEQLGQTAVVLADDPRGEGVLSGSARSAAGVDLVRALGACGPTLASFGGHAEAAGVKVLREELERFRGALAAAVTTGGRGGEAVPEALPAVSLGELSEQFEADIWRLAPYGPGFSPSRCVLSGCQVVRVSCMGRDKTHLNLIVGDGQREVRLPGFYQSHLAAQLQPGQAVRPVVEIEPDNWNNRYSIMLRLVGLEQQHGSQEDRRQELR